MAAEHRNYALIERLITALEEGLELCTGRDRDALVAVMRTWCDLAARLAADLEAPG